MINKVGVIIQARVNSKRFPNKILYKISNKPIIFYLFNRLKLCTEKINLVVAIPKNKKNNMLANLLKKNDINVFRGPEKNTLKRYYEAAKKNKFSIIVRITSDCPFADPILVDHHLKIFKKYRPDYLSNNLLKTFPHGYDIEIFSFATLEKAFKNAKTNYEKEHVTPYIRKNKKFKKINIRLLNNFYSLRVTLDYKEDFIVIKKIINHFKKKFIHLKDLIQLYRRNKFIFNANQNIKKFENFKKNLKSKRFIDYSFKILNYKIKY